MGSWLKVQEEIAGRDWIAEITLTNITPVRIGGYNARPFSDALKLMEGPRAQSIKGLWRWWARAILAGATLCGKGTLGSFSDINDGVSKVLGSTEASSEFFIQIAYGVEEAHYVDSHDLEDVPRVKLVTMGLSKHERELERYYGSKGLSLRIVVGARRGVGRHNENAAMFALSSLIVSLVFSGIGSMTTRGFGKLKIESLEAKARSQTLRDEVDKLSQLINDLYMQTSREEVTKKLKDLIWESLRYASRYASTGKVTAGVRIDKIPPYPTLLPDCRPEVFRLETVCISKRGPQQVLECLGRSTLKAEWKRRRGLPLTSSGKSLHTWVLGLPRCQELRYEKDGSSVRELTGYILDSERRKRRQSSIGFTVLECPSGLAITMYGFITSELAETLRGYKGSVLRHIGVHTTRSTMKGVVGKIKKNGIDPTKVYDDLLNKGILHPRDVWRVSDTSSVYDAYRLCFDAAWDFVKQIIMDGCCR